MVVGSVPNGFNLSGGFSTGLANRYRRTRHQPHLVRFLRSDPGASEGINVLPNTPSFPSTQESVGTIQAVPVEATTVPSHAASPIIHIRLRSAETPSASASVSVKPPNPATPAPRDAPSFDIAGEERLLRNSVDKALAQGV
ncbi:hypothetical protein EDB83DRAFT_1749946 [Lactarius deliciosus]|nr:hypothetical protein EDB83DRAFT_1749946 [Lactarius deliciosus]